MFCNVKPNQDLLFEESDEKKQSAKLLGRKLKASAGLSVDIKVVMINDKPQVKASASGTVLQVISNDQEQALGINGTSLTRAVDKYFGKAPNNVYVKSPTPWGDLYNKYNWQQTSFNMTAVKADVISVTSTPTILSTNTFRNTSSVVATYNASMSYSTNTTLTSSWSTTTTVTTGVKITASAEFEGIGGSEEFSITQSTADQKGGSTSHSTTLTAGSGVQVTLQPGQTVHAHLISSVGTAKVRVTYRVNAEGFVAVNYNPTFKGHHFWALPAKNVMAAGGISMDGTQVQDFEITYFSNATVTVTDQEAAKLESLLTAKTYNVEKEEKVAQEDEKEMRNIEARNDLHMAVPVLRQE